MVGVCKESGDLNRCVRGVRSSGRCRSNQTSLPFTLPGILRFASLAGIGVNESILLVEFAKRGHAAGIELVKAARRASVPRFRAVFLTSATTIVDLCPMLLEKCPQAQMLVPVTARILFGVVESTLLVGFMVPVLHAITSDFRRESKSDAVVRKSIAFF